MLVMYSDIFLPKLLFCLSVFCCLFRLFYPNSAADVYRHEPGVEFSRLESLSPDVSRPYFQRLSLGLGLEVQSPGLGLKRLSLESKSGFRW